ncbi:Fic family protein [Pseudoflavitalea sp. X16]|uniref:Fic family protein n=1 Tax=Paraflavitalea devenefica TaxID=2716334 RepID=UPI00142428E3|nr:Fic family protein [Paraflavitalea devenefica]NII29279.1 Fic family protein [Paraflavitalea devenefica]
MNIAEKLKLINTLKGQVDKLMPQKDWDEAFLEKVKVEFTYNSNKIEGNTITYGQTVKLLRDFATPKNATTGEVLDIVNHKAVLDIVFNDYHLQYISEENIKELHKELMKNIGQWGDNGLYSPGKYKVFENMTVRSTGKIHTYLQPAEVEKAMEQLIKEINQLLEKADINDADKHPLSIATRFHQRFLNEIHPFSDGNGRIGRIFTNLILLRKGYPPLFIREVNKNEYLKRFELTDHEPTAMLDFMADRLIESLQSKLEFIEAQRVNN